MSNKDTFRDVQQFSIDMTLDPEFRKYRRENKKRIFVNRDILLDRVKFVGFDMDYTLAEYISPVYEMLTLKHAIKTLVDMGYPQEIEKEKFNSKFASRGIVFDRKYGIFLKVDPYGNIMKTVYGFTTIDYETSKQKYKNRFVDIDNKQRFANFYTLFEVPSVFLIALIIKIFEEDSNWKRNETETGFVNGSLHLTFNNIYEDVSNAFDVVHKKREMKQETLDSIATYVKKDDRLPVLLKRIRESGRKTMLVTNSDYWYTHGVMSYLLGDCSKLGKDFSNDWKEYFDLIVVDAAKPKFFAEGNSMCQIDIKTGKKSIGVFKGKFSRGDVFSGGNSEIFCESLGCVGKEILFVGDHIFGDILKSKKKQGWRTFLVIPELINEITMWVKQSENYIKVEKMETEFYNNFTNMDSASKQTPSFSIEKYSEIKNFATQIEDSYGRFGSLFRCGWRQSLFANQIIRFADLYSHSCLNLLNYPFFYYFQAPILFMPHESTVNVAEKN